MLQDVAVLLGLPLALKVVTCHSMYDWRAIPYELLSVIPDGCSLDGVRL